jgi:carboxymethylenebutenolidase
MMHRLLLFAFTALLGGCVTRAAPPGDTTADDAQTLATSAAELPADAESAEQRLMSSPRHGEWVTIADGADSIRVWLVYPERSSPAPVVVVVHEIFGVSDWIRGVTDQLAADGFIAIAPDFLTGKGVDMNSRDSVVASVRRLENAEVQRRIDAVARWGMALPAAQQSYGVVGFCWGGQVAFSHAVHAPTLGASVVYYGTSPRTEQLDRVRAPVLGLYGEDDQRVNATIAAADSALRALGRSFRQEIYPGAGHGFLRQQRGREANLEASRAAWPRTIGFFRTHLERNR